MADHDQQKLIEVDANLPPKAIFKVRMTNGLENVETDGKELQKIHIFHLMKLMVLMNHRFIKPHPFHAETRG